MFLCLFFRVILSFCRKESFGFVRATDFAFLDVLEFASNHLTTHRRYAVGEDVALEVVVFVLHDASKEAVVGVGVLYEIFVEIVDSDRCRTCNFFVNARHAEATLFVGDSLLASFDYLWVNEYAFS